MKHYIYFDRGRDLYLMLRADDTRLSAQTDYFKNFYSKVGEVVEMGEFYQCPINKFKARDAKCDNGQTFRVYRADNSARILS